MWDAWKEYMAEIRDRKAHVKRMAQLFRNYHLKPALEKFKRASLSLKSRVVGSHNSVHGGGASAGLSQLKYDELKKEIKGLDKALQLIYNEKASKDDLNHLKA